MNDGGPAFPIAYQHEVPNCGIQSQEWAGMTLRDYFAAKAMSSIVGSIYGRPELIAGIFKTGEDCIGIRNQAVREAYEWADAMISERTK